MYVCLGFNDESAVLSNVRYNVLGQRTSHPSTRLGEYDGRTDTKPRLMHSDGLDMSLPS